MVSFLLWGKRSQVLANSFVSYRIYEIDNSHIPFALNGKAETERRFFTCDATNILAAFGICWKALCALVCLPVWKREGCTGRGGGEMMSATSEM